MYQSILVTLDGSALAEQALPIAVGVARRLNATLTLLRVLPERRAAFSLFGAEFLANVQAMYDQHRAEVEAYITTTAQQVRQASGLEVRTVVTDGDIAGGIRRYATASGVDLIVMTTHGRTGLSRAWLGSVADAVVRQCRIPTLLWRPIASGGNGDGSANGARFHTVVIPLDGSDEAEQIFPHAVALGGGSGTSYSLVRVVSPIVAPPSAIPYRLSGPVFEEHAIEQRAERAGAGLHGVEDRIREQADGATVSSTVVVDQHVSRAILAAAERSHADLIAMTTHGRGAMRYLLGSVADKVLRGASGAVLMFRPPSD